MTHAGPVVGRISHTNTIIRRARSTRRTSGLISKPTPTRCPKRSELRPGNGDKVLVDAREDRGMEVTAKFGKPKKWPIR